MKPGFNRSGLRSFFTYFTVPLIICVVLIYVGFYYMFNRINKIFDYEKIQLFIECNGTYMDIAPDIYSYMNEEGVTSDEVKEVDLYNYQKNERDLYDIYLSLGVYADLLILPEYDLEDIQEFIGDNFLGYDENEILSFSGVPTSEIPNYKYFYSEYDEFCYGIKIYDAKDEEYNNYVGFTSWLNYEDEEISYYLIINLYSENIKEAIDSSTTNNAFIAMGYLLNRFRS